MYNVTIYEWEYESLVVTPFHYWEYAMKGYIIANMPISLVPSISTKTFTYKRIRGTNNIQRIFSVEELEYVQLSPPNYHESDSYEVMSTLRTASIEGIENVANDIGMYLPLKHPLPHVYFENNVKYYLRGVIITDQKIFNKIGYIPYYSTRDELLRYYHGALPPPFYYKDTSYYYHDVLIDTGLMINQEKFINPLKNKPFKILHLKQLKSLVEMVSKSNELFIVLIKKINNF
jgi:hypothetical protein